MNAPEKATEIKALLTAAMSFVVALLGWVGIAVAIMLACMLLIRHKTKHPKFMVGIPVIIVLQVALIIGVLSLL